MFLLLKNNNKTTFYGIVKQIKKEWLKLFKVNNIGLFIEVENTPHGVK